MIKKIFNNRRLKWFLFILMFALVSLYIGCNLFQVGAYNLPDYIVTKDSNLIDDLNYLGFDLTNQDVFNSYGKIDSSTDFNYESNQNDSNFAWKLLTMEENYTEKNNQVVQYFYFYNRVSRYLDSTPYYSGDKPSSLSSIKNNLSFAIKLSVNNVDYSSDFSTDLNGSHTFDNVGFMTYCSSYEDYHYFENPFNSDGQMAQVENRDKANIVYDSGYEYYILKLRLNLNYANRDESRTYKISEITGTSSLQDSTDYKSNSVDCFYNPSNCNFTFSSVYEKGNTGENTNPDDVVVEAPKLENVKALYEESTNTDCINFQFSNIYANSNLTKVKLNDDIVELSKVSGYEDPNFDNKFIGTYQTINYKVSEKGTCTYYIKGFYFGNKYIDVSEQNVKFRYVSTHTSVLVEAKKELFNGWGGLVAGSYSVARFSLQEKATGYPIENAVEVTAQYYYAKEKKVVSQKVADASWGSYFNSWKESISNIPWNQWNGYLQKLKPEEDGQDNYYKWTFNFEILPENFDIIQCRYEFDNQIITGSCYKDGLHIENGKVYDMDGKLRDDYKVDENGGITDNNGQDPGTDNPPTTPTEPDDPDLSIWQRILKFLKDTFGIDLEKYYKTFKTIIIVLLSIVCMPLIITLVNAIIKCIKAIIKLFKKKE